MSGIVDQDLIGASGLGEGLLNPVHDGKAVGILEDGWLLECSQLGCGQNLAHAIDVILRAFQRIQVGLFVEAAAADQDGIPPSLVHFVPLIMGLIVSSSFSISSPRRSSAVIFTLSPSLV